jgi:hypothetical protein
MGCPDFELEVQVKKSPVSNVDRIGEEDVCVERIPVTIC